jgi:hypothetical protein
MKKESFNRSGGGSEGGLPPCLAPCVLNIIIEFLQELVECRLMQPLHNFWMS